MDSSFSKIFWGFIIVFIDFRFILPIDILADPIGYYLIYLGIKLVLHESPIGKKASYMAIFLAILSISTIFHQTNNGVEQSFTHFDWYLTALTLAHFILTFYVFQLIVEIAKKAGDEAFVRKSSNTFISYYIINFVVYLWTSFSMNLSINSQWATVTTVLFIISFIIGILFLALLWSARKISIDPSN